MALLRRNFILKYSKESSNIWKNPQLFYGILNYFRDSWIIWEILILLKESWYVLKDPEMSSGILKYVDGTAEENFLLIYILYLLQVQDPFASFEPLSKI